MGSTFAQELSGLNDLRVSLEIHLRSNHYPPVPLEMVDPCIDAINAARFEDWNLEIQLPGEIRYKNRDSAPAWAIVEAHHLESWINNDLD